MSFKVAIIGAGSVGFTKTLISDLLKVPEFADVEFALSDIYQHNLDMILEIIAEIVAVNNLPARVSATRMLATVDMADCRSARPLAFRDGV